MKAFSIKDHPRGGEYIVGPSAVGSRTTYLVYNEVEPGRSAALKSAAGHEEILLVLSGRARVTMGGRDLLLEAGQGAYLGEAPDGVIFADGEEVVRFVCAGGHVPGAGHHH
jgi:mannose-6-phosphate isomerase-like protein (cupin superfamily)